MLTEPEHRYRSGYFIGIGVIPEVEPRSTFSRPARIADFLQQRALVSGQSASEPAGGLGLRTLRSIARGPSRRR